MINHSRPFITQVDINAVIEQLKTGNIARGQKVKEFEAELGTYLGMANNKLLDSGSKAIKIALQALEIQPQDEVVIPTYVCNSVLDAVLAVGATPVLTDVSEYWNTNINDVSKVITNKTKAIILVHSMGIAINNVSEFKQFGIPIIEDCCQAFGAKDCLGNMVGTVGDIAVYSFHATKCLTIGEGGLIATNNSVYAEKISKICKSKANGGTVSDLQAALGISQLSQYDLVLKRRRSIATYYFNTIENRNLTNQFKQVFEHSICFRFLLTSKVAFEDAKFLFEKQGIAVRKGVDELLHKGYPQFAKITYNNSERVFNSTLSIPIYPELADEDMIKITNIVNLYEKL